MIAAAFLLAQAAATQPATMWNHIALGAPAMQLRPIWGDPLRILTFDEGGRVARYWLPGENSTYVLVIERRGYVSGFDIFTDAAPASVITTLPPDPLGVHLGDTFESVKAQPDFHASTDNDGHPLLTRAVGPNVGVAYTFQNGRVQSMHWTTPISQNSAELAPLSAPAGDSPASAILDVQANETDGVAWEYRYLAFHPCADNERWQLRNQSLINAGGAYDRLHVICPSTKSERDFYFDITSYFGKL